MVQTEKKKTEIEIIVGCDASSSFKKGFDGPENPGKCL